MRKLKLGSKYSKMKPMLSTPSGWQQVNRQQFLTMEPPAKEYREHGQILEEYICPIACLYLSEFGNGPFAWVVQVFSRDKQSQLNSFEYPTLQAAQSFFNEVKRGLDNASQ